MVFRNVGDAKVAAARSQIETFGLALDAYRLDNDYYPATEQGLDALVHMPQGEPPARGWRGPYLKREVPVDPWGTAYQYRLVDDQHYDLRSLGRDGKPGGDGEDADLAASTLESTP
jgi:general secretion pathway protein G